MARTVMSHGWQLLSYLCSLKCVSVKAKHWGQCAASPACTQKLGISLNRCVTVSVSGKVLFAVCYISWWYTKCLYWNCPSFCIILLDVLFIWPNFLLNVYCSVHILIVAYPLLKLMRTSSGPWFGLCGQLHHTWFPRDSARSSHSVAGEMNIVYSEAAWFLCHSLSFLATWYGPVPGTVTWPAIIHLSNSPVH